MDYYPPIKPFWWCAQKALPAVYSDELSYLEVLSKMSEKLNEVINRLNNIETDLENVIDEKLKPIYSYIDSENQKQNQVIANNKQELESKILELQLDIYNKIQILYSYIDSQDQGVINIINQEIAELKSYVDNVIVGKISIYDPVMGFQNSIQKTIDNVYNALRVFGITCTEFENSKISCNKFKSLNITCIEFATRSRKYIFKQYGKYIYDADTGEYIKLSRAFYNFVKTTRPGAITCDEFKAKSLTADGFKATGITVFQFDTDAKNILP